MSEIFSVRGKNVVITGAGMGIGFGIANRFAEAGANVLIADIDENAAFRAAERLATDPANLSAMGVDVSKDGAGEAMVARCVREFGSIDVLVNNAGIFPATPMLQMKGEDFDRVWQVNLRGLAFASQAAARRMLEQQSGGSIINIGSIDSVHPSMVGLAAYDASKGAVLMFTRNFALELAPHRIRVNVILPGAIDTEGTHRPLPGTRFTPEQQSALMQQMAKRIPMGRLGRPDDIAKVALFLASDASGYMTGASVTVDGGILLT